MDTWTAVEKTPLTLKFKMCKACAGLFVFLARPQHEPNERCNLQVSRLGSSFVKLTFSSILAAKISTEQTSTLGSQASYMKKLLSIVRGRMQDNVMDITMKFTLSALWNLTDESPRTCKVSISVFPQL